MTNRCFNLKDKALTKCKCGPFSEQMLYVFPRMERQSAGDETTIRIRTENVRKVFPRGEIDSSKAYDINIVALQSRAHKSRSYTIAMCHELWVESCHA
jgi:hypothetical protein